MKARYITESQDLSASHALGLASNAHDHLDSWQVKGTYFYRQTIGLTAAYFNIRGTSDAQLYGSVSANNSPNSNGEVLELDYIPFNYGGPAFWPWLNMKLGVQYIHYNKFDGAALNFDGAGRNATDNDTFLAFAWFAF